MHIPVERRGRQVAPIRRPAASQRLTAVLSCIPHARYCLDVLAHPAQDSARLEVPDGHDAVRAPHGNVAAGKDAFACIECKAVRIRVLKRRLDTLWDGVRKRISLSVSFGHTPPPRTQQLRVHRADMQGEGRVAHNRAWRPI